MTLKLYLNTPVRLWSITIIGAQSSIALLDQVIVIQTACILIWEKQWAWIHSLFC